VRSAHIQSGGKPHALQMALWTLIRFHWRLGCNDSNKRFVQPQEDTIVAPATALGGGVAVVRLSGPLSREILRQRFQPAKGRNGDLQPRKLVYGTITAATGEPLDDALAVLMPAPHSFTGEDIVEFHCHGGHAVVRAVLEECTRAGARLAEPGEFSKRAFLNGRMDLAQAEALSDLIAAQTEGSRRAALQQLRGGVSSRVREVRDELLNAAAEIEAHLDFPEEDIPPLAQDRIGSALAKTERQIVELLAGYTRGRVMREGARVVLAGSPNAGKSSLFNALVGRERALVSPHPGTTRDTIESTIDLRGVAVTLVDTAGLRESQDAVERMGIERTGEELERADLVLLVVDAGPAGVTGAGVEVPPEMARLPHAVVLNKVDEPTTIPNAAAGSQVPVLHTSAITRAGLDALADFIASCFAAVDVACEVTITHARHAHCLQGAQRAAAAAHQSFNAGVSGELVMVEIRDAINELGEIIGERLDEQILDRIFSTFCLGK